MRKHDTGDTPAVPPPLVPCGYHGYGDDSMMTPRPDPLSAKGRIGPDGKGCSSMVRSCPVVLMKLNGDGFSIAFLY